MAKSNAVALTLAFKADIGDLTKATDRVSEWSTEMRELTRRYFPDMQHAGLSVRVGDDSSDEAVRAICAMTALAAPDTLKRAEAGDTRTFVLLAGGDGDPRGN